MIFAKQIEDSSPEKIRKTIFIFASIVYFVITFDLSISAPNNIFHGANGEIVISSKTLLSILMIIQIYLFFRLIFSWNVSVGIFEKGWNIDEFKIEAGCKELLKELNNFQEYWSKNKFNINDEIKMNQDLIKSKFSELDSLIKMEWKRLNTNTASNSNVRDLERISFTISDFDIVIKDYGDMLAKHNLFVEKLPKSHYKLVLESKVSKLSKARKIKQWEMYIFDLGLPLIISIISIYFCLAS